MRYDIHKQPINVIKYLLGEGNTGSGVKNPSHIELGQKLILLAFGWVMGRGRMACLLWARIFSSVSKKLNC